MVNIPKNPKIMLAGSVNSSLVTLEMMIRHGMNIVGVLGLRPESARNVSGYQNLEQLSREIGLPYVPFRNINDEESAAFIQNHQPDLLFVIGLSQLVRDEVLKIPAFGCVGFHPTKLPKGRGRGAVAWLILGKTEGAATFFQLDEGMDSGPILVQEPFSVSAEDYASDVIQKITASIRKALDQLLPALKLGRVEVQPQDHSEATYLGRRRPEDGLIDWNRSPEEIQTLIRATSSPLPGAFTYCNGKKMVIQRARVIDNCPFVGVPGRILRMDKDGILVQAGDGSLLIQEFQGVSEEELSVGKSLGMNLYEQMELVSKLLHGNS